MNIDIEKVCIVVSTPVNAAPNVRDAVCKAGAGVIGNYSYCTSSMKSLGTFMPNENASPYIGEKNKMEYVEEETLKFVCDVDKVKSVLIELRKVHPYEEPAIEIYPLIDEKFFN